MAEIYPLPSYQSMQLKRSLAELGSIKFLLKMSTRGRFWYEITSIESADVFRLDRLPAISPLNYDA